MTFTGLPLASVVVGIVVGTALVLAVKWSANLVTPEDPLGGMVRLIAINVFGMMLAVAVLGILFVYLRTALMPFGLGLVFGFIGSAVVQFVRNSGAVRTSD